MTQATTRRPYVGPHPQEVLRDWHRGAYVHPNQIAYLKLRGYLGTRRGELQLTVLGCYTLGIRP